MARALVQTAARLLQRRVRTGENPLLSNELDEEFQTVWECLPTPRWQTGRTRRPYCRKGRARWNPAAMVRNA
eukprot:11204692-Lingulodinium_polyedra.AAC.1